MTIPTILIGLLLSTVYGFAFHVWRGGGMGRLVLYLVLGWAGFWAGHFLGEWSGWTFNSLGALRLGMATVTSAAFLLLGHWLSLIQVEKK